MIKKLIAFSICWLDLTPSRVGSILKFDLCY